MTIGYVISHPSWLTGKLGDFTWLLFAPFIAGLVLAWVVPRRLKHHTQWVASLSFGFIGIWFATAKTIPMVMTWTKDVLEGLVGWRGTLGTDATDLVTLPALLIGWWIWQRVDDRPLSLRPFAYVALGLGLLGTLASDNSNYYYFGIVETCIYEEQVTIKTQVFSTEYLGYGGDGYSHGYYLTDDGGLTWDSKWIDEELVECIESVDKIINPLTPNIQYRWIINERIERSNDGGETWETDYEIDYIDEEIRLYEYAHGQGSWHHYALSDLPLHATFDPNSGNIIFAMGLNGILVRHSNGEYQWVQVSGYGIHEINTLDKLDAVLYFEIWLTLAIILLVVTTAIAYISQKTIGRLHKTGIQFGWMCWIGLTLFLYSLRLSVLHSGSLEGWTHGAGWADIYFSMGIFSLPIALVVGLPLSLNAVWHLLRYFRRFLFPILLVALGNGLLYLFPYLLWSQGRIPRYTTAVGFVALLMVCGLYASYKYLKPLLPIVEPEKGKRVEKAKMEKTKIADS